MARGVHFAFKGGEEYLLKLTRLSDSSDELMRRMVYAGADVVTDAIRDEIQRLPEIPRGEYGTRDQMLAGVTAEQKEGLLDGLGITPIKHENGGFNAKIGFEGYNKTRTAQYPKGQPNVLIARSVESGTSFRQKQPFVSQAVKDSRKPAVQAMQSVFDEDTKKIME